MGFVKEGICKKCGKSFTWKIDRPGDGFWDRWKSDNGSTLATWFLSNSFCWDHAMEVMPDRFRPILQTTLYEEPDSQQQAQA